VQDGHGHASSVRARWVIGCDGGARRVRGMVGITLDDLGFDEPWLVVDVRVNDRGLAQAATHQRAVLRTRAPLHDGHRPRQPPALGDLAQARRGPAAGGHARRHLAAAVALAVTPTTARCGGSPAYRFHALVAERWRVGRVFIAGDAAHMQPPFLGQGMCQGVRDVANLAWKLAAVHQGQVTGAAAERLLDSYGQERQAHVRELTTRLKALGAIICERDPAKARERDARLLAECGGVVKDTPRQDVLPRLETGLLATTATSGRGTLFPQPRLRDGRLMDQRFGCGWRLVGDGSLALPAANGIDPIDLITPPEADGVVAAWMQRHGCHAALLRPDHYVYGTATDAASLQALLAEQRRALND
jgi:3-(3-hydroxy-phenyl)propionate hydroxylase